MTDGWVAMHHSPEWLNAYVVSQDDIDALAAALVALIAQVSESAAPDGIYRPLAGELFTISAPPIPLFAGGTMPDPLDGALMLCISNDDGIIKALVKSGGAKGVTLRLPIGQLALSPVSESATSSVGAPPGPEPTSQAPQKR